MSRVPRPRGSHVNEIAGKEIHRTMQIEYTVERRDERKIYEARRRAQR